MFNRRRPPVSVLEYTNALIEADKALRQRDAATRHALGRQILADIDSIAMHPTWDQATRRRVLEERHAIKNLVAMRAGLPPVDGPQRQGIEPA